MKKILYLLLFITGISHAQIVSNPGASGTDYLNLSQDATVSPIINTYIANVRANGGSITDQQIGALNYLLKGLNQLGILSTCTYLNPCMGNNWQAAVTNVINISGGAYITSTATITDAFYSQKYGWIIPNGTQLNTNYNPSGQNQATFISCNGFSQNTSNNTLRLVGTATHGLLKLNDNGANYYIQGRNALASPYGVLTNIQGNHIITNTLLQQLGIGQMVQRGLLFKIN